MVECLQTLFYNKALACPRDRGPRYPLPVSLLQHQRRAPKPPRVNVALNGNRGRGISKVQLCCGASPLSVTIQNGIKYGLMFGLNDVGPPGESGRIGARSANLSEGLPRDGRCGLVLRGDLAPYRLSEKIDPVPAQFGIMGAGPDDAWFLSS